jgi:hypothetical protein
LRNFFDRSVKRRNKVLKNWPKIFLVELIDRRKIREEKVIKLTDLLVSILSSSHSLSSRLIFNWLFNIKEELSYFLSLFLSFRGFFIDFMCIWRTWRSLVLHTISLSLIAHFNDSPQYDNVSSSGPMLTKHLYIAAKKIIGHRVL